MTRPSERDRLLGLVSELILKKGMLDLSLSAIAREIGSNNRMLLYYFSSRENLLDEASMEAFNRFPRLHRMFTNLASQGNLEERLVRAWDDLSFSENRPYLRLYFQRFGVAMRDTDGWQQFKSRAGREWVASVRDILTTEGYSPTDASRIAIQVVALWRGFQVLLLTDTIDSEQLKDSYRSAIQKLLI